ncbi:MAG: BamA/TamA family outer membrane protein [Epsilonproteobacteria bacterium]|nr:BamA/TamA family outer membrane protein [Campylobacterota bacterium]
MGTIEEISGYVPESKLFFGGGMFSNRAYGYNELGTITSPTEFLKSGALSMANLSCEINFPIKNDIYGAVFTDNTMLSSTSYDFNSEIISSAGFGIRYITPVGPLKIDIGSNINDVSQFSIQFQLGQSF